MRKLIPLFLLVAFFALTVSGCGPSSTPTETLIAAPTATPAEEPTPAGPPANASLGDIWIRPADGMTMAHVPAGEFEMGSDDEPYHDECPVHTVALDSFWIDRSEVTNDQYRQCVAAGACGPPEESGSYTRDTYYGDSAYDDYPVIYVTWHQAVAYCEWAGARLPTEAEWEYAACGPDAERFPWGDEPDRTRLNYCDTNCLLANADQTFDDGYADTAPVGTYPTGTGWCAALDMIGNAWEWVADWFSYYYPSGRQVNPTGPPTGVFRVIRGGSWDTHLDHARCTYRNWFDPTSTHDSIGFRCVSP